MVAVVRLRHDPRTRAYVERRMQEGLSKMESIRCLKRCLAREVFRTLRADLRALHGLDGLSEQHGTLVMPVALRRETRLVQHPLTYSSV
jgi:hypothetical protein